MSIRIAYVEEPPFYWTDESGSATGADIELARQVFDDPEFLPVRFEELLPGVAAGKWDANVPIFVTLARAQHVTFSRPVWALGDGFVVRHGNPKALAGYAAVAARADARLGLIPGQVQVASATGAGVADSQQVMFPDQAAAVAALLLGEIDAFAATAVGNRVIVAENPALDAVELAASSSAPVGAFSFSSTDSALRDAVDARLGEYLGSADHRLRMAKYGIAQSEIDPVL